MLTRRRGSDTGNLLAMLTGFLLVAVLSGLPNQVAQIFSGGTIYMQPKWLPVMEFPWWVMFGSVATFLVAVCFRTADRPAAASELPAKGTVEA